MKNFAMMVAAGLVLAGCGDKIQEMKEGVNNLQEAVKAVENLPEAAEEAETFYKERAAKGDTIAMAYKDLQAYLPSAPSGYSPEGGPEGSQQSMGAFSFSQSKQIFTAGENGPRIEVMVMDYGGTQSAYGMASLAWMMNLQQEDDHRRSGTVKFDTPYTFGYEEYNKDNHESKITAGTRYRYTIQVIASNQTEDNSAMVKSLVEDIAKKFDGK